MIRVVSSLLIAAAALAAAEPIRLHPGNPHYFLFRGKPTVLITSGEHYGAVINLDFDYKRYLKTLAAERLNLTRTFAGSYRESPGSFDIRDNTLAPKPDRFLGPWARTETPGAADGLGKFDLSRWNGAYFARLKDFIREVGARDIVVEFTLFCPFYGEEMWKLSPMNSRNNVNGVGDLQRTEAFDLKNAKLQQVQDDMARKIVAELRGFDNVMDEICNEPYTFDTVTAEWQRHMAGVIADAESAAGPRHLITQNVANGSKKVPDPDPRFSVFNFHYSRPPQSVTLNYDLRRPIGNNETGFVVSDRSSEIVVERHALGRPRVVEVENREARIGVGDLLRSVGYVLRNEVARAGRRFGIGDHARHVPLPLRRHRIERVRLVADLVHDVVEATQLGHDLPRHIVLHLLELRILEVECLRALEIADAIDVVARVHGAQLPHLLAIERAEEGEFHDDVPRPGLAYKILEAREVGAVPTRQVELTQPIRRAGRLRSRPRAEEAVRLGRQSVAADVEGARRFPVGAGEGAREVQPFGGERLQVAFVVEVQIDDGAIVFARRDEDRGLSSKEKVMRIPGMQPDRLRGGQSGGGN